MIPFRGNSSHTIKIKNKPIKECFKVWVLGDEGYVWHWLWYSIEISIEGILKKGDVVAWSLRVAWFRAWRVAPRIRVQSCLASQLSSLRS
jgi:hypothetical protein